ncbi:putative NTP binding protein [Lyophyllum shimeji]|uniref:NTP binding protein n=1 Tax=Lyophyllum shimeji TaxID=47721 RepID=A0A9P3PDN0_LYOSH|nr:putative NTP binding protein [Lyophyllum shimeji]
MDGNTKVASLAARLVESNRPDRHRRNREEEEDDDEALFAELEAEIENDGDASIRERGLDVLRREMERMQEMKKSEHGQYTEITDEKEVVRVSAHEPRCVVHFYHTNFKRCEIMDKHLRALAPKYFSTRFIRVFVESVPWLVEKLGIKVLPCVICFVDGVSKDRLIGFEQLGNSDKFDTAVLELRLSQCGVIQKTGNKFNVEPLYKVASRRNADDEEVFDLDD